MAYIALYWGVMLIGYFVGSKVRDKADKFNFVGTVMLVCISGLVFIMGMNMGSNKEVIDNLGSIGVEAFLLTVVFMIGAVISITITRRIFKIDKMGYLKGTAPSQEEKEEEAKEEEKNSHLMTILIVVFVILGLIVGYFLIRPAGLDMDKFSSVTGNTMTAGICFMLLVIGFDMGLSGTVIQQFKTVGLRIFAFPVAIVLGTTVVAVLCSFLMPLSAKETLAIGYGFGWYTFAPIAITNGGFVIAGAVSFMHNVFRELGGMILIPVLAKKIGYIEVTGLVGVAGMDIAMPIVEKATRQDLIAYSFVIGVTESLMVPLLVPLVIGG